MTGAGLPLVSLSGPVDPVKSSPFYQLGLLLVAIVMILLPLIYIGLIVTFGYLVYLHATRNISMLTGAGSSSGAKGRLIGYLGPIVCGAVVLLFMVKPLFAPRAPEPPKLRVSREQAPLLHKLIEVLCAAIGAPIPAEVVVDCQVNASASFRRGVLSMFGNDLTLTVGLPLVSGLSLRQFAGVLAHEFGHFAQGTAMRLTYLIRSINFWFARVVYERDAWDQNLEAWSRGVGWNGAAIVLMTTRGTVWLTRRVLWCLMWVGHIVSSFMLRQMEFDADLCEIRVAGSRACIETFKRLPLLALASQGAFADLERSWSERRLCDDLPALIMANVPQVPAEVRQEVERQTRSAKTGWFDSHPADSDRIAVAQRMAAPGLIGSDAPATALFENYGQICRAVSTAFYSNTLGEAVNEMRLVPTETISKTQADDLDAKHSLDRLLPECLPLHWWIFPVSAPVNWKDGDAMLQGLLDARSEMQRAIEKAKPAVDLIAKAHQRNLNVVQVRALRAAGFKKIQLADFGMKRGDEAELTAMYESAASDRLRAQDAITNLEAVVGTRIAAAIGLAEEGHVLGDGGVGVERARSLLESLVALRDAYPALQELETAHQALCLLLQNLNDNPELKPLIDLIVQKASRVVTAMQSLRERLSGVPYPFEHAESGISIARYAVPKLPAANDLSEVYSTAGQALENTLTLYVRVMAGLARIVEQTESAMGLPSAI